MWVWAGLGGEWGVRQGISPDARLHPRSALQVYFRKPTICNTLTNATREKFLLGINRQSPTSKLSDFFHKGNELILLMEHQSLCQQQLTRLIPAVPQAEQFPLYNIVIHPLLVKLRTKILDIPRDGPVLLEDSALAVAVVINILLCNWCAPASWTRASLEPQPFASDG